MRISNSLFVLLIVSLVLLPFTASSKAANLLPRGVTIQDTFMPGVGSPIGKILLVQGKAVVVHGREKDGYRIEKDMPLFKGDTVVTQERSRLRYQLNDDSVITMAASSRVVLSQSEFSKDKERAAFLKLDGGKARFLVKKILKAKRSEFKVKTPTALVGVRGSDFIIKASKSLTEVTTLEHTLLEVLSGAALDKAPLLLSDMQKTTIEKGSLPSDIENISQEEMEALHEEFAIGREMRSRQPQGIRGDGQRGGESQDQDGGDEGGGDAAGGDAEASDEGGGDSQDSGGGAEASDTGAAEAGEAGDSGGADTSSGGDSAAQSDDSPSQSTTTPVKLEAQANIIVPVEVLEDPVPMSIDSVVDTSSPLDQDILKQLDVTEQDPDVLDEIIKDTIQQPSTDTELVDFPADPGAGQN